MLLLVLLKPLLEHIPSVLGLLGNAVLFFLVRDVNAGYWGTEAFRLGEVPKSWYQGWISTFLGFPPEDFFSGDYFSLAVSYTHLLRRSMNTEEEKFLSAGDIFLDGEKHMVYVNDEPCELTFKEYELLKLLIQNQGIVMSRDVIMERIWGINFEGESRTLDVHIKTLRQKLKSAGALIKTVRNVGYIICLLYTSQYPDSSGKMSPR